MEWIDIVLEWFGFGGERNNNLTNSDDESRSTIPPIG